MTRFLLGIDGGGTKTQAVIVDENGRFCSQGFGGPSNYDDVGIPAAQTSISQAVSAARQAAKLPIAPFAATFLGIAGVVSPTDRAIIANIAQNLALAPADMVGVDHDCRIALAGGLSGRPGMVQIAGTGSSTFGINAAGETWRAGGWGQLISDEGSGYWLGIKAMQTAVRAFDGRLSHTLLLEKIQTHLGLSHLNDILHRIYSIGLSRAEIAALSPLVIEAAEAGDAAACNLINEGADLLAECVQAVAARLGFTEDPCQLALVGGMFKAGDVFRWPFEDAVVSRLPHCRLVPAELPPVLGACVLAMQQLNIGVTEKHTLAFQQIAAVIA